MIKFGNHGGKSTSLILGLLQFWQNEKKARFINPYGVDEFAQTIKKAIEMTPEEISRRMKKLGEIVRERNIYRWAEQMLTKAIQIS